MSPYTTPRAPRASGRREAALRLLGSTVDDGEELGSIQHFSLFHQNFLDPAPQGGLHFDLHLHGFDHRKNRSLLDEVPRGHLDLENLPRHRRPHLALRRNMVETPVDPGPRVLENQRVAEDGQGHFLRAHDASDRAHLGEIESRNPELATRSIEVEPKRALLVAASHPGVGVSNLEKARGGIALGRRGLAAENEGEPLPKARGRKSPLELGSLLRNERPVQLLEMRADPIRRDPPRQEVRVTERRREERQVRPRTGDHHRRESRGEAVDRLAPTFAGSDHLGDEGVEAGVDPRAFGDSRLDPDARTSWLAVSQHWPGSGEESGAWILGKDPRLDRPAFGLARWARGRPLSQGP